MGRQRSQKAAATEALVKKALQGIEDGTYKSPYDAEKQLNVNRRTVQNRLNMRTKSRVEARGTQQALSPAEEQALARWVIQLTHTGHPARHFTVREMAEAIRIQRIQKSQKVNQGAAEVISLRPLGEQWVTRFLKCHEQLQTVAGHTIEGSRVKESSPEKLMRWFNEFKRVVEEYKVDVKNIYNMDEMGFSIGTMQASSIIIDKKMRTQFQASPGRQEWISIVECVSMDGRAIPPLIIFKGERLSTGWIPNK